MDHRIVRLFTFPATDGGQHFVTGRTPRGAAKTLAERRFQTFGADGADAGYLADVYLDRGYTDHGVTSLPEKLVSFSSSAIVVQLEKAR